MPPARPAQRDAAATKRRLLDAAIAEFAAHGLAGGRVDRIAAAASANKRAIYDHFGSKEQLFTAAVTAASDHLTSAIPLRPDDLPGYAGALYDHLLAHPATARLIGWRRLEGRDLPTPASTGFLDQVSTVGDTATQGKVIGALDMVVLVIALANAWDVVGTELAVAAGLDPLDPGRLAEHRAAVVEATRRLTAAR